MTCLDPVLRKDEEDEFELSNLKSTKAIALCSRSKRIKKKNLPKKLRNRSKLDTREEKVLMSKKQVGTEAQEQSCESEGSPEFQNWSEAKNYYKIRQ